MNDFPVDWFAQKGNLKVEVVVAFQKKKENYAMRNFILPFVSFAGRGKRMQSKSSTGLGVDPPGPSADLPGSLLVVKAPATAPQHPGAPLPHLPQEA